MPVAAVSQLKAKLSAYLAQVKRGEEVLITDHGKPVARIVPIPPAETDEDARLQRMAAKGLVKLGKKRTPEERAKLLASLPVRGVPKGALLRALEEDREESE